MKKEDIILCKSCCRGDFKSIVNKIETGKWLKDEQKYSWDSNDQWYNGCWECGGYGYLASKSYCLCGKEVWFSPGAYTIYEGKKMKSYNGVVIIYGKGIQWQCEFCVDKKS